MLVTIQALRVKNCFWRQFGGTFLNGSLSLLLSVIDKVLTKNFCQKKVSHLIDLPSWHIHSK